MSAQRKKQLKQQQRRQRKKREAAHRDKRRGRTAGSVVGELRVDEVPVIRDNIEPQSRIGDKAWTLLADALREIEPTNELEAVLKSDDSSQREETETDIWWGTYSKSDGAVRLQMAREKLATVSTDDETYRHFFPEAIDELEPKLAREDYVVFLEELRDTHPETFAQSADWHTRTMVFEYLAQNRVEDADRAVVDLADRLDEIREPFFSLMSTIRLAGRTEAAQALIDAAMKRLADAELMYWAVDDILSWAMFIHYQRCATAGVTDEAVETLHAAARKLGIEDDETILANRRQYALHLAGKSDKQWTLDELTSCNDEAFHNIYLLGADFQRWLCESRELPPIVADELARLVLCVIDGIKCPFSGLLTGLPRQAFDRYLAGHLGFMSLKRIHAPASIIAMQHYYDFLKEIELVKPGPWQRSQAVCDGLWKQLQKTLGDEWKSYAFLEPFRRMSRT